MIIMSTKFNHKDIHKVTWISPDGETRNTIDHVLIDARPSSNIIDVRSFRGANVDSDHHLVGVRYRARISRAKINKEQKERRYNVTALKDPAKTQEFERKMNEMMCNVDRNSLWMEDEDVGEKWSRIKNAVKEVAEKALGYEQQENRNEWFDNECAQITKLKNKAYVAMLQKNRTRFAVEVYREARKDEKRIHKAKKREYFEKQTVELNEINNIRETRRLCKKLNSKRKEFKPRSCLYRNKDGDIVSEKQEIMETWREHFDRLLNEGYTDDERVSEMVPRGNVWRSDEDKPTINETKRAIQKLKNNKSPGTDGIASEIIKYGGEALTKELHKLICMIWRQRRTPQEWKEGIICPLHKKGDQLSC